MTTYQPHNPNKEIRPDLVSIGCEIASRAMEEYEYGYLVPIKTKIVFIEASREIIFSKKGSCNYKQISALLQSKGFSLSMWCLKSVWETQPEPENYI